MSIQIITNNHPRPLLSGYELSEAEAKEFDYIDDLSECFNQFFRYRGQVYDTSEFVAIVHLSVASGFAHGTLDDELLKWHGIQTDSFFSATLIKYDDEYENVIVARLYS